MRRSGMTFYLGSHHASQTWFDAAVPLFVSRTTLAKRKRLPRASEAWALDSGGFTELHRNGRYSVSLKDYAAEVRRFEQEIGELAWAACLDWMCEESALAKTGLTVKQHQTATLQNFLWLRQSLGDLVIPILQGWHRDDYLRHAEQYERAGVDLSAEEIVGVGSICRRNSDAAIGRVLRSLLPLRLHAFGVRSKALGLLADVLASADSMAWSYRGRHTPGCSPTHKSEANCIRFALKWREDQLARLDQLRLEVA